MSDTSRKFRGLDVILFHIFVDVFSRVVLLIQQHDGGGVEDLGGVGICGQMEIAPVILGGYKNIVDAAHREKSRKSRWRAGR